MPSLKELPTEALPFEIERRSKNTNMNRRKDDMQVGWRPEPKSDGYQPEASSYRWWSDEYITKNEEL
jgi:hypothetical protein